MRQLPNQLFGKDVEDTVVPWAARRDMGVLVYGPLVDGSPLAGVTRLTELAREPGIGFPQLALAWTLAHLAVYVAAVGARPPSRLDGTAAAADVNLCDFAEDRRGQGCLAQMGSASGRL